MSTPLSLAMDEGRGHIAGFNPQTDYNTFLPSSEDQEMLAECGSSLNPYSDSTGITTPHFPSESSLPSSHPREELAGVSPNTGLSPSQNGASPSYTSEYEQTIQDFVPQDYNNDAFLLEADFGPVPATDESALLGLNEPQSATSLTSSGMISTGIATLSSQLMSPVLTEHSPRSENDGQSPAQTRLLGGGPATPFSSDSSATGVAHGYTHLRATSDLQHSRPILRVESYTRGDSPARFNVIQDRPSKRRRSSFLAPDDGLSEEEPEASAARSGVHPSAKPSIADRELPNFQDQQEAATLQVTQTHVNQWLRTTLEVHTEPGFSARNLGRRRAKSTSTQLELDFGTRYQARERCIPGPGLLLAEEEADEDEVDEEMLEYMGEDPANANSDDERLETERFEYFPHELQPCDAHPWIDPIYIPSRPGVAGQPGTANAAMMRFALRAQDIETASRAATWGTQGRRMSEGDLDLIFGPDGLLSRLSIGKEKEKDSRRGFLEQIEQAAAKFLSKRSASISKRRGENAQPAESEWREKLHDRRESLQAKPALHERKESGSRNSFSLQRKPSTSKRPKSPKINTGGTVAALATQIVTLGGTGSVSPTLPHSPARSWSARNVLRRTVRGEFYRTSSNETPDLLLPTSVPAPAPDDDDDESGIAMDFTPSIEPIIPTFEGFKINVRDVNPRLPLFLVERLGQEQLRRYKKLVEFKVKHAQAAQLDSCPSGEYCINRGSHITYFPGKASQKEPTLSHTGFTTAGTGDSDEDADVMADGAVTAAQFPLGVPLPPVKRLPAQFECPLCFTVKKFQKPSDWSKHVHEDLQPFTCTFPNCPDPKSFKRKADWVRHENERHRHLEWWTCTEPNCGHRCFRRDNYLQHLVREHKMPEPKVKSAKPNKSATRGPAKVKARGRVDPVAPEDIVLSKIESCRHETTKDPRSEPCRFCGNVCNTWKKLTVHLARHMEQISMPVLTLARQKDVAADTIISPIEVKLASYHSSMSPVPRPLFEKPIPFDIAGQDLGFASLQNMTFPQPQFQGYVWPSSIQPPPPTSYPNSTMYPSYPYVAPGVDLQPNPPYIPGSSTGQVNYSDPNQAAFVDGTSYGFSDPSFMGVPVTQPNPLTTNMEYEPRRYTGPPNNSTFYQYQ